VRTRVTQPVNLHAAKTGLSKLVARAQAGEGIVITRAGTPVAKLVGLKPRRVARRRGLLDGKFKIPDDFNRPLPRSMPRSFEGLRVIR